MEQVIRSLLPPDFPWLFHWHPVIGSTNDHLKMLAREGAPNGTIVLAGSQTHGRGRLGRSFHSPKNEGIYLSALLRPKCSPGKLMHLTCAAAVAVCNGIEAAADFRPQIKWTNDIVCRGRKLGGILTELGLDSHGMVDYAIVGIGLNCCQQEGDFPPEIAAIASSLSMAVEKEISSAAVAAALMQELLKMDQLLFVQQAEYMARYRRDCITLGKEISLIRSDGSVRHGTALDISGDGALLVRFQDGRTEAVNSGEVSVRGMYGYV